MRLLLKAQKVGGEGSRGGKVIGHTSSGHPIYESSNVTAAVAQHPSFSASDHTQAATNLRAQLEQKQKETEEMAKDAIAKLRRNANLHDAAAKQKGQVTNKSLGPVLLLRG